MSFCCKLRLETGNKIPFCVEGYLKGIFDFWVKNKKFFKKGIDFF